MCRSCILGLRMIVADVPVWYVALHGLLEPRTAAVGALEGLGGEPRAPLREEAACAVSDITATIRRADRDLRERLGRVKDIRTPSYAALTRRLGQRGRHSSGGTVVAWAVITIGRHWDEYCTTQESVLTARQLLALRDRVTPVLGWQREFVHKLPVRCPACTHRSLMVYVLDNRVACTTCATTWNETNYKQESKDDDGRDPGEAS
jgi:hypothetical protein